MLGGEIVDGESDVAIAIAEIVGLGAAMVDRQLNLEIRFRVAQIDEREPVETESVGDRQSKTDRASSSTRTIM